MNMFALLIQFELLILNPMHHHQDQTTSDFYRRHLIRHHRHRHRI
jgi:hypothetical protein